MLLEGNQCPSSLLCPSLPQIVLANQKDCRMKYSHWTQCAAWLPVYQCSFPREHLGYLKGPQRTVTCFHSYGQCTGYLAGVHRSTLLNKISSRALTCAWGSYNIFWVSEKVLSVCLSYLLSSSLIPLVSFFFPLLPHLPPIYLCCHYVYASVSVCFLSSSLVLCLSSSVQIGRVRKAENVERTGRKCHSPARTSFLARKKKVSLWAVSQSCAFIIYTCAEYALESIFVFQVKCLGILVLKPSLSSRLYVPLIIRHTINNVWGPTY